MFSISCKSEDELTLGDIKSKLYLAEKQEKLQKGTEAIDEKEAQYSRKHQQQPFKKTFKNWMKSSNHNNSTNTADARRNVICFACNNPGHISRNCPKFKQHSGDNRSGTTSGNGLTMQQGGESAKMDILDNKSKTDDEELIAPTVNKDKTRKGIKSMWRGDSGTAHHMTPFIDILVDFDVLICRDDVICLVDFDVIVADERETSVEGKDNVVLKLAEKYGNENSKLNDVSFVPSLD